MSTEEWFEVLEQMTDVWENFTSIVKEIVDSIADLLNSFQGERKKHIYTPRQYRMSLLIRRKFDPCRRSFWTNYIPATPKNRPYQQRNFQPRLKNLVKSYF